MRPWLYCTSGRCHEIGRTHPSCCPSSSHPACLPPLCLQQLRLIARDPSRSPLPRRQLARARRFWVGWVGTVDMGRMDGRTAAPWVVPSTMRSSGLPLGFAPVGTC
jgi:hypothetical protein